MEYRSRLPVISVCATVLVAVGLLASAAPGRTDEALAAKNPVFHTRSIVACDPQVGQCGIAVVSFPSGVPAVVPVAEPGIMVANQKWPSFPTARAIIDNIEAGADAPAAVEQALAGDPDPSWRTFGVAALSPASPSGVTVASWPGYPYLPEECHLTGPTYAVQAGLQTSTGVCTVMAQAFEATPGLLARRLLRALLAGAEAGNDARGEYSATVRVISGDWTFSSITPWLVAADVNRSGDWRGDVELGVDTWLAEWGLPGDSADLVPLSRERGRSIQRILRRLRFYCGPVNGVWNDDSEAALRAWGLVQLGWERPTVVRGATRYIEEAVAGYLILGWPRGVLVSNPDAGR